MGIDLKEIILNVEKAICMKAVFLMLFTAAHIGRYFNI